MSDHDKPIEIEDTLSSIRRLVAEGDRHRSDVAEADRSHEEKLVLTSALRVADDSDQTQGQSEQTIPLVLNQPIPSDPALSNEKDAPEAHTDDFARSSDHPPQTRSFVALSSRIAALETAIAETDDQWEPDGSVGDDYAGTDVGTVTLRPDANTGGDSPTTPQASAPDDAIRPDAQPDLTAVTDALMDSESLQKLVSDIVHKELQGEAGQRITRTIRKLVRREIQRAMAAQGLD
ncbi:hypothetical protein [Pontibaca salina]|uniref:Uncharacterized protein n=1 Tax=Pontibaca salina TaxID=2795731 RepID=A0A934HLC9_9RHOB|nr:hypothetical protein [Pontibaca salina]MBI6630319.1 hypothetical protein [Pontibaca salina]